MEVDETEEMPPLTDAQAVALYLLVMCGDDWREALGVIVRGVEYDGGVRKAPTPDH